MYLLTISKNQLVCAMFLQPFYFFFFAAFCLKCLLCFFCCSLDISNSHHTQKKMSLTLWKTPISHSLLKICKQFDISWDSFSLPVTSKVWWVTITNSKIMCILEIWFLYIVNKFNCLKPFKCTFLRFEIVFFLVITVKFIDNKQKSNFQNTHNFGISNIHAFLIV